MQLLATRHSPRELPCSAAKIPLALLGPNSYCRAITDAAHAYVSTFLSVDGRALPPMGGLSRDFAVSR